MNSRVSRASSLAWGTALAGYGVLLAALLAWHGWMSPPDKLPAPVVAILFAAPLLAPLRGLLRGRSYTFSWTIFLALAYFLVGAAHVAVPDERRFGVVVIVSSLTLFAGCIAYVRARRGEGSSRTRD